MSGIATTPKPPYYAVIFTSKRSDTDDAGYAEVTRRMLELSAEQPGFLGIENASSDDGIGITVSYWESLEAIRTWQQQAEHQTAQQAGRDKWYNGFYLRICHVERAYDFQRQG
jgi:heme-degrading monooxygenase HmoA